MKGPLTAPWGKLQGRVGDDTFEWHPLRDHCVDVAVCCEVLLEHSLLGSRLARLGGLTHLSEVHRARLVVLAFLHDLGKTNRGFQNKAWPGRTLVNGHVQELVYILDKEAWLANLSETLAPIFVWTPDDQEALCRLWLASVCHHGRPVGPEAKGADAPWEPRDGYDPFREMRALVAHARQCFPRAWDPEPVPLPTSASFQHAFSGLVMLADWLGSDRRIFPYSDALDTDRLSFARHAALDQIRAMGLDPNPARRALAAPLTFQTAMGFEPRLAQEVIAGLPIDTDVPTTVVLEAETGAGKTEAALFHYLRLFQAGAVDGLYFALPTRTAATQIDERVEQAIARVFPDPSTRPPVVLAVPGYLRVDDTEGVRLPGFEVLWNDVDAQRFRARSWAAENAKRYLAGAIVVGTIDQVLMSTLTVGHAHLRSTALMRLLLVVDEVHASDTYMTRLLEAVLDRHRAAGGHTLLMSATLGTYTATRLLGDRADPALPPATDLAYPLVTHRVGSVAPQRHPVAGVDRIKRVERALCPWLTDADGEADLEALTRLVARAIDAAKVGAKVLILRNTVKAALATQSALERAAPSALLFRCGGQVSIHHSRFARDDRKALDHAIEQALGKDAARDADSPGCIVVATQTVQQSLDLNADLLMTDLCPMDVLLQRLGRLHRHDTTRPPGFERARVEVLVPSDRDLGARVMPKGAVRALHGLGTVYEDLRVIEATWRLLETHSELVIPEMNRALVEATTAPSALEAITASNPALAPHDLLIRGLYFAGRQTAKANLVDWTIPFGDAQFPSGDLDRRITTRLGDEDHRVVFAARVPSPFGNSIAELTVPHFMVRDWRGDGAPVEATTNAQGFTFALGDTRFTYDRLGLRPAGSNHNEELDHVGA